MYDRCYNLSKILKMYNATYLFILPFSAKSGEIIPKLFFGRNTSIHYSSTYITIIRGRTLFYIRTMNKQRLYIHSIFNMDGLIDMYMLTAQYLSYFKNNGIRWTLTKTSKIWFIEKYFKNITYWLYFNRAALVAIVLSDDIFSSITNSPCLTMNNIFFQKYIFSR